MSRRAHPLRPLPLPPHPSVPVGQAATLDATLDQTLVRTLGALPLLLPLCDHLGLRAVVNRRCYPDGGAPEDLARGRVALVLVLNRLLAPQPLVHVERWLAGTVVPDLLGLSAAQCNDDRLARTLAALLPHLDALWQDLIVAALTRFALLELQARRAGLSASGRTLLAQAAPLAVVLLRLPDGATLRRLANLGPPVTALLHRLGWPAATYYC